MGNDWWARGLLFENCSCQLVCPAHVSFKQRCENDRCIGHWAVHINEGQFGSVALEDRNVAVVFESSVQMYEGDWIQRLYIDERGKRAGTEIAGSDLRWPRRWPLGNTGPIRGDAAGHTFRARELRGRGR